MSKLFSFSFAAALAAAFMLIQCPRGVAFAQEGGAATKANLDLPFDAEGDEEDEEEAPEIIVFYGQQYEGDGIFFSCDKSSSMQGAQWTKLQKEVVKNITQFSERVQFGICFYDSTLVKFPSSGRPADATPPLKAAAIAMVMSTQTGSGSCSKPSLIQALTYAQLSTVKRKVIIHLADGYNHCGGQNETEYSNGVIREVTQRNVQGVQINTICIGTDVNEEFMKKLSAQNRGQYARVQ